MLRAKCMGKPPGAEYQITAGSLVGGGCAERCVDSGECRTVGSYAFCKGA